MFPKDFESPQHPMCKSMKFGINVWETVYKKPITTNDSINFGLKMKKVETVSDLLEA